MEEYFWDKTWDISVDRPWARTMNVGDIFTKPGLIERKLLIARQCPASCPNHSADTSMVAFAVDVGCDLTRIIYVYDYSCVPGCWVENLRRCCEDFSETRRQSRILGDVIRNSNDEVTVTVVLDRNWSMTEMLRESHHSQHTQQRPPICRHIYHYCLVLNKNNFVAFRLKVTH